MILVDDDLADVFRIISMVIGVWCLVKLFIFRGSKWQYIYTTKEKRAWTSYLIVSLWVVEGSYEMIVQDIPGGPRTFLGLFAIISVLWVLYSKDDRRYQINVMEHPPVDLPDEGDESHP